MIAVVFGGTGTLGSEVVPLLIKDPQIGRIRVFSRNEHKQAELYERWESGKVDLLLGDIRDYARVKDSLSNVDLVYHFAATKRVETAEYNPREAKTVNIDGTENIIRAIRESKGIFRAMFTSTDKACSPLNFYGATKLVAERYWIAGNIGGKTRFSVCRYGNVLGSQGSVLEKWDRLLMKGRNIQVTDGEMTRFFITPKDAAKFVTSSMLDAQGGETFIPFMKSTTMNQLGAAFLKSRNVASPEMDFIPLRPGEKKHEVLISEDQLPVTTILDDKFIQWPEFNLYPVQRRGRQLNRPFTSFNATRFTEEELLELCRRKP